MRRSRFWGHKHIESLRPRGYLYYGRGTSHILWYATLVDVFQSTKQSAVWARICLFASYGSPQTLTEAPYGAPLRFGPQQRVSILKPRVKDAPDLHLFYNDKEFRDAFKKCGSGPWSTFDMDPGACDYLYFMTNGHPCAVSSLVSSRSGTVTRSRVLAARTTPCSNGSLKPRGRVADQAIRVNFGSSSYSTPWRLATRTSLQIQ